MKKFLFILSFLAVGALTTMNAQTTETKKCSKKANKACCAKKTAASADAKTTSVAAATMEAKSEGAATKACTKTAGKKACCAKGKSKSVAGVVMTASEAAASDESIEARTCAKSGNVSYYQKSQCPASGKVTMSEVNYNMESGKFVNASPSEMEGAKKSTTCNKQIKSAKVVKTSVKE